MWYRNVEGLEGEQGRTELERTIPKSVRRRYKTMENVYRGAKMRSSTHGSAPRLHFSHLKVLFEHQGRLSNDFVSDLIKRVLVVFVFDGTIDEYWVGQEMVAWCLSFRCESVLHWMMYFCSDKHSRSGIWYHATYTSLLRGATSGNVRFVNAQTHNDQSKRGAGFNACTSGDVLRLRDLYPRAIGGALQEELSRVGAGWDRN